MALIILEFAFVMQSILIFWYVPVFAQSRLFVTIDLALKLVPISEVDNRSLRAHHIVRKRSIIGRTICKDHLAKTLKCVLIKFSDVEQARRVVAVPVLSSAVHSVPLK